MHPVFDFDKGDFFLKCAKVFGDDVPKVSEALLRRGHTTFLQNDAAHSLSFPRKYLPELKTLAIDPAISICLLESDEEGTFLREVGLEPIR